MDRDFLRVILLVAGLVLVLGLYFWAKYKQLKREPKIPVYEEDENEDELYSFSVNPVAEAPEKSVQNRSNIGVETSLVPQDELEQLSGSDFSMEEPKVPSEPEPEIRVFEKAEPVAPLDLVQFLVVPRIADGFGGDDIERAAKDVGLLLSRQGILQLYQNDKPVISVVSMVEPGVFPIAEMASYQTPGLVLFFQPGEVPEPQQTLDDLVETCLRLADTLDGLALDSHQNPLTKETLAKLRDRLPASDRHYR